MKVDVKRIMDLKRELDSINSINISDLELYEGDQKLEVSKNYLEAWEHMGGTNLTFITGGFYKR